MPSSTHAQYPGGGSYPGSSGWVPSYSDGTPIQRGNDGYNYDGTLALQGTGAQPTFGNTYPIPADAESWWLSAYSPNSQYLGSGEYYSYGLSLASNANNDATDPWWGDWHGYYDPLYYTGDILTAPQMPPDIVGSVFAHNADTLSGDFVWTGPGPVPPHVYFLLQTSVSASASVNYGTSGDTAGLSATATAGLGQDSVTATAGDAGSSGPQSVSGRHLVRVVPAGNIATVSLGGTVSTDVYDLLPLSSWQDAGDGTSYYYGPGAGPTSASTGAYAGATAEVTSPHPINFHQDGPAIDDGNGNLIFTYSWESSTGHLEDLVNCDFYEHVSYDGNPDPYGLAYAPGTYYPPDPPFDLWELDNPTMQPETGGDVGEDMTSGVFVDRQFHDPFSPAEDLIPASFTGMQEFRYHSDDMPGDALTDYVVLMGPMTITRQVYQGINPGTWFYSVSKSGQTATLAIAP